MQKVCSFFVDLVFLTCVPVKDMLVCATQVEMFLVDIVGWYR